MVEVPMILDTVTLIVLVVLYFAYDRRAVPAPPRENVQRDASLGAPSRGRVLPFRPRRAP
jgi:hypothetical protein